MNRLLLALLCLLLLGPARAHEMRPVFLGLSELPDASIEARLKLPVFRSGDVAALQLKLPADCRHLGAPENSLSGESLLQRSRLRCAQGLDGLSLELQGFSALVPDGLVTARFADGREASYAVSREYPRVHLEAQGVQQPARGLLAYVPIGIRHILLGADHLLFVLGLLLVWRRSGARRRVLIATVTAFTLAHSLTLSLAVLGAYSLPPAPVEALIALSILLLAVELARAAGKPPDTLSFRKPWLVAFGFGLLHGFGFAGALRDTGLPEQAQAWALLLFNLGVELGQLAFIASLAVLHALLRRATPLRMPQLAGALHLLMGSVAAAWFIERSAQVLGVWNA